MQIGIDSLDSAPAVILGGSGRTNTAHTSHERCHGLKLGRSSTGVSELRHALLSQGRTEMVVGRGSFIDSFPLFGFKLEDYDSLFAEKLDLLLKIRENGLVH